MRQSGPPPTRRLSGLERLWLVADRLCPPFVNQMVLEGEGVLTPPRPWGDLLEMLAEAQPLVRARLRGTATSTRWVADGPTMRVREVAAAGWDGLSPEGAPFLAEPLDPWHGPACELLVVRGATERLVLRTHHALTDGRGTLLLARALFATLRGEPPSTAVLGPLNDCALARTLGVPAERMPPQDCAAPMGSADGEEMAVTWGRRRVPGRCSKLVPRLALALARGRPVPEGLRLRVDVPVDLRPWAGGLASTANLTGLLRLPLDELAKTVEPLAAIAGAIEEGVARKEAAGVVLASEFGRFLPLGFMAWAARGGILRSLREGRYGTTAVLSNLGKLDLPALSGAGFRSRRAFFIPPGNPRVPLFLAATGDDEGIELCVSVPRPLATRGRLDELLDLLARAVREG